MIRYSTCAQVNCAVDRWRQGVFFCFLFFLKTNSLLENQNSFIDLTFTQVEQVQIKTFFKIYCIKIHRLVSLTKVTLIFLVSFKSSFFFLQLTMTLNRDYGNHVFHLLKRLCLTLSNVICGFRGYLHGKEACIVNLPVGRISCPSSYLICMPLLDPQQQLNCQLILLPNEIV